MNNLPSGTVTFLFTDIEGSTKLWQQSPDAMPAALARHHEILHRAIESHNGYVFQIIGDAFCAAFATAFDGLDAALGAQRALRDEPWGETGAIRVRMALHTGTAQVNIGDFTSGEYVSGITLSRAARLLSAGHGGQILLSSSTTELVREALPLKTELRDLGAHRLKDLVQPQQMYQVLALDLLQDFPALKTLDVLPNNLPIQLTSFIGRERETQEIKDLLTNDDRPVHTERANIHPSSFVLRLLTLTGAGGSGKTRLSLQVAADVIDDFEKGAWFVDLSPLTDPALVPNSVMSALELRGERSSFDEAGRPPLDALADYLSAKHLLLILDNCEHLVEACAQLANHLLTHCPNLTILATSREALGVAGEVTYQVPVLGLPDPNHLPALDALSQYDSVRLFIERALAVQPNFSVTNANAPAVAQICYRLDGIPLAIELAAARIKLFSPGQIAALLDDRFRLLTGGSRTVMPRQQTLRAAIEWSYSLLSEQERILFRRLSVFVGGWTFEAAEAVCVGDGIDAYDVLELLSHLVDKSLVITAARGEEPRYRMLETIREYAFDKLRDSDEVERIRNQHLDYFLAFAELANRQPRPGRTRWRDRMEIDHDNLRVALRHTFAQNDPERALLLCNVLAGFWTERGYLIESRRWYEQAIASSRQQQAATPISEAHRVQYGIALDENGSIAYWQGDYATAHAQLEEALAIKRALGDKTGAASVLNSLGGLAWYEDKSTAAQTIWEEALALNRELEDTAGVADNLWSLAMLAKERGDYIESARLSQDSLKYYRALKNGGGAAWVLENLGWLAMIQGDYAKSKEYAHESFALRQESNHQLGLSWGFTQRGYLAWHLGDCRAARAALKEGLTLFHKFAISSFNTCLSLTGFAAVDMCEGEYLRGTRLLAAIRAESERTGRYNKDIFLRVYNQALEIAQAELDAETFNAAWEQGRALTMEQAIELALQES